MASFCKQCHDELFPPPEVYDFEGIITENEFYNGSVAIVLCEGCGDVIAVNHKGERVPFSHRETIFKREDNG